MKIIATFLIILFSGLSHGQTQDIDCGEYQGLKIPCWTNYLRKNEGAESLPFFPYAKRPNGCSVLNLPPGEADSFEVFEDRFSFKYACETHDRCYYTLNSNRHECNELFLTKLIKECSHGTNITRPVCMARAQTFYKAAESVSLVVHAYSQNIQRSYLAQVMDYLMNHGQK